MGHLVKPALHHGATGWGCRNVTRLKQTGANARGQNLIAWTKKGPPFPSGMEILKSRLASQKRDASLRVAWLQVLLHSAAWLFLDRNPFRILDFSERPFDKGASLLAFDDEVDGPSAQLVVWRVHERDCSLSPKDKHCQSRSVALAARGGWREVRRRFADRPQETAPAMHSNVAEWDFTSVSSSKAGAQRVSQSQDAQWY